MENIKPKTIMFSGGGTGGPVTPLLAIAAELIKDDSSLNLIFIGTKTGPVKDLVADFKGKEIKFLSISSGKWRRYFSIHNFLDIFKIIAAFWQSLKILKKEKPDLVISAGGFVSVPLIWAAACRRIPILIHQQDIRAGLANRLMAPFARVITVTFDKSLIDYGPRAILTGNPLRDINFYATRGVATRNRYSLALDVPLILIIGGGTGSLAINNLIFDCLPDLLSNFQVIHLVGQGKKSATIINSARYQAYEFLSQDEVLGLMAAADLVISRCGFGVLTELSALAKPVILIPIPNSHQEDNAAIFKNKAASIVLSQNGLTSTKLLAEITSVLGDSKLRGALSRNINKLMKPDAAKNIAAIIWEMIK